MLRCKNIPNVQFIGDLLNFTMFCCHSLQIVCAILMSFNSDVNPSDTKPRVELIQSPEHTLMHAEESVSFICHINISTEWKFLWYKDGSPLTVPGNNLNISSLLVNDAGSYQCQTRRGTSLIFSSDSSPTINLSVQGKLLLNLAKICLCVFIWACQ